MISKEEWRKLDKEQLVDLVYDLLIKVDKLTAEVQELREEVKMLKTPKNSGNRSFPSFRDLFNFRNQSLREKSDKKSGGQPGHKWIIWRCWIIHIREKHSSCLPNPDKIIEHRPDQGCPQCGKIHADEQGQLFSKRQVIDIPIIKASVIEHQIFQTTCTCGYISTGNFPGDVCPGAIWE